MKLALVIWAIFSSANLWADCAAKEPGEVAYKVGKMTCDSCANLITKQFSGLPQVASAKADFPSACLKMKFKVGQSVSEQEVSTTLSKLGYAMVGKGNNAANNAPQVK